MNERDERPGSAGTGLTSKQPPRWTCEGLVLLVVVLVGLQALLRPDPEPPLPDFTGIERADELKRTFFAFLAPIVAAENERVLEQRSRLLAIAPRVSDERPLGARDRRWMKQLAAEYELEWPGESRLDTLALLLRRVDVVPAGLALVQAAKESGWGRSRFARQGNNLFGHWCYQRGCGLVPSRRSSGAVHEVAAFDSVRESVRRYFNNLNTHDSYLPLRRIREAEREAGVRPRARTLADGLIRYSQRREAYVAEIKQILRANRDLIAQAVADESTATEAAVSAGEA